MCWHCHGFLLYLGRIVAGGVALQCGTKVTGMCYYCVTGSRDGGSSGFQVGTR
jgi:hypothetical protein